MNDDTRTQTQLTGGQPTASPPLSRRVENRVLAGVASGVADYLRVDPIVIRLVLVLLTIFAGGLGLLLYLVGWIAIPERDADSTAAERALAPEAPEGRGRRIIGVGLLTVGILILAGFGAPGAGPLFLWSPDGLFGLLTPGIVWAVVLIGAGFLLYRLGDQHVRAAEGPGAGPQVPPAPHAPQGADPHASAAPPTAHGFGTGAASSGGPGAGTGAPPAAGGGAPGAGGGAPGTGGGAPGTGGGVPPAPGGDPGAGPAPGSPAATPRPRPSPLGRLTLAAALVAVGIGALLDQTGVLSLSVAQLVAVAIVVIGLGLLVGTFLGRGRWLIAVAFALLPVLAIASVFEGGPRLFGGPLVSEAGAGERSYTPASLEEVRPEYTLGTGRLDLDLSQVEVPEGETVDIDIELVAGEIEVRLPADAAASLQGSATFGEVSLLGRHAAGIAVQTGHRDPGSGDAGEVSLDLRTVAGRVNVERAWPADPDPADDDTENTLENGLENGVNGTGDPDGDEEARSRRPALVFGGLPAGLAVRVTAPPLLAPAAALWEDR